MVFSMLEMFPSVKSALRGMVLSFLLMSQFNIWAQSVPLDQGEASQGDWQGESEVIVNIDQPSMEISTAEQPESVTLRIEPPNPETLLVEQFNEIFALNIQPHSQSFELQKMQRTFKSLQQWIEGVGSTHQAAQQTKVMALIFDFLERYDDESLFLRHQLLKHTLAGASFVWWTSPSFESRLKNLVHRSNGYLQIFLDEPTTVAFDHQAGLLVFEQALILTQPIAGLDKEQSALRALIQRLIEKAQPAQLSPETWAYLSSTNNRFQPLEALIEQELEARAQLFADGKAKPISSDDWLVSALPWWFGVASDEERPKRYSRFWQIMLPQLLPEIVSWSEDGNSPEPRFTGDQLEIAKQVFDKIKQLEWLSQSSFEHTLFLAHFLSELAIHRSHILDKTRLSVDRIDFLFASRVGVFIDDEFFAWIKNRSDLSVMLRAIASRNSWTDWATSVFRKFALVPETDVQLSYFDTPQNLLGYLDLWNHFDRAKSLQFEAPLTKMIEVQTGQQGLCDRLVTSLK